MKPCVIYFVERHGVMPREYVCLNEDGKVIARSWNFTLLSSAAWHSGFKAVPLNSRLGRTILDKYEGHVV